MKILIVNPIIYTSETSTIKKRESIKDSMIVSLCEEFSKNHEVTLYACESYKPINEEKYNFSIIWEEPKMCKIFKPNVIPYLPKLKKYLKNNNFDLIISSESFSLTTYICNKYSHHNLIIWQELAKHNNVFCRIPSKIWYNLIVKYFYKAKIVARSYRAQQFIRQYSSNVLDQIIEHGINFIEINSEKKENYFIVLGQLIPRKRVDTIIEKYYKFFVINKNYKLLIIGDGIEKENLEKKVKNLKLEDNIKFLGNLSHNEMFPLLLKAQCMLINTKKDNNMISILESIGCGTPVITNSIPFNSDYIQEYKLGIVNDNWDEKDLIEIINNKEYRINCLEYRHQIFNNYKIIQFLSIISKGEKDEK